MRATMLLETVRYGVPFGPGNRWPKMCAGSQVQPLLKLITTPEFYPRLPIPNQPSKLSKLTSMSNVAILKKTAILCIMYHLYEE